MNFYSAKAKALEKLFFKEGLDKYIDNRIANAISNLKVRIPQSQINDAVVKFFTEKKWFLTEDGKKVDTYDLIRKFAMNTIGVAENGKLNPEFLAIVQKEVANILAEKGIADLSDSELEPVSDNQPTKCDFPDCKNYGSGSLDETDSLCNMCDNFKVKQKKLAEQEENLKESKACEKNGNKCSGNCKCHSEKNPVFDMSTEELEDKFIEVFQKLFGTTEK